MVAILRLLAAFIANLFKSRRRLEAEILFLRHQLNIALRRRPGRSPTLAMKPAGQDHEARPAPGTVIVPLCLQRNASPFSIMLLLV